MSVQPDIRSQLQSLTIARDKRPVSGARPASAKRGVRWILGVVMVVAIGIAAYAGRHRIVGALARAGAPDPVKLVTVTRQSAPGPAAVLTATGKIVSDHTVNVSTKVSGQIVSLHFEQGDSVEAGQVLARIEDVLYRARRDEAAARLEQAKANLEFQKTNFQRVNSLRAEDSAPPIEFADAKRLLDEGKAQVAAGQAALDFAQKALNDTVVTAPIGGVILTRNVEVGDFVAAEGGIGANANARFATIADMSKLRVEVDVSELDIARLDEDMPCKIVPDAYKDREYPGHIMWIDPGANYSKATVQVKVRIENPDAYLRVDGTAQVRFLDQGSDAAGPASADQGVWIPAAACTADPSGDRGTVFVAVDGVLHERPVQLGPKRGDMIEIRSGLAPGQRIAVPNGVTLVDGQPVPPQE